MHCQHPFHCWCSIRPPCALSLLNLNIPDSWHVRKFPEDYSRNVRKARSHRLRNTLKINPDQRRNRGVKAKKPATESTRAQGPPFYEELSFSEQNVHITVSHLSAHCEHYPGSGPRVGAVLSGNIRPGGVKPGLKGSRKALKHGKTGNNRDLPLRAEKAAQDLEGSFPCQTVKRVRKARSGPMGGSLSD